MYPVKWETGSGEEATSFRMADDRIDEIRWFVTRKAGSSARVFARP